MSGNAVSPIKVDAATKERIRLASAALGIEQGEFVRRLVIEYVGTSKPLRKRVEEARAALLDGDEAMVRYLRGGRGVSVSVMDTGWTRALSTSKFVRNHAASHLWARLGSNQRVPTNAPSRKAPLSRCFAGVLPLARLVAYRVLSAPFGCSDGHRMDTRVCECGDVVTRAESHIHLVIDGEAIPYRPQRWTYGRDDWAWSPIFQCWASDQSYYCLGDRMFHRAFGATRDAVRWHGSYSNDWHGGIQTSSFTEAVEWLRGANGTGHDLW